MAKAKNTDKGAALDIQLKTGCFEDAALVRRAVFMDEQGYENEFDQIDEDPGCIHVTLYVDGQLTGCSRVFPEELERAADAEAPVPPACDLDEGVAAGETYIMGRVAVLPAMRRRGLQARSSRPAIHAHAMPALNLLSCTRRNTCCRSMKRLATHKLPRLTTKTRASPMPGWPSA